MDENVIHFPCSKCKAELEAVSPGEGYLLTSERSVTGIEFTTKCTCGHVNVAWWNKMCGRESDPDYE